MKTIGMIGGTGWVSSTEYYKLINIYTNQQLGGLEAAKCILYSVNYADIERFNQQNDNKGIYQLILNSANNVIKSGAELLILCANTLHQYAEQLKKEISIPLIHIGEETAKEVEKNKMKKVGLLGTIYTMEMDFYKEKLKNYGIDTLIPEKKEREKIHSFINNELLLNIFRTETKSWFLNIINQLKEKGADGIILGCTEIPLLIKQEDTQVRLFNTMNIHAKAAVTLALDETR